MRYSLKAIHAILEANGCLKGIPSQAGEATESIPYYYPRAPLTVAQLLQDTLAFIQQHSTTANRRVCFLWQASDDHTHQMSLPNGIIVCFSAEQPLPASLLTKLTHKTAKSADEATIKACYALYQHVQVWLVGGIAQEVSTSPNHPLFSLLQAAYGPQVQFYLQPIDSAPHANLVFAECLLRILSGESLHTIDAKQAFERHRKACAKAVAKQLNMLQATEPLAYDHITTHLRVLFKYAALRQTRVLIELSELTARQRLTLQKRYFMQKQLIYSHPLTDLMLLLQSLSLEPLIELWQAKKCEDGLSYLQTERQAQLQDLKHWEAQLFSFSCWTAKAYQLGQQSWQHLYQYSFIGLGAELTPWLGQYTASWLTASPQGILWADTITQWISPISLRKGCQWLGAGLGAWGTYTLGGYWLGKSCLTGLIAQGLKASLAQIKIDDVHAEIILPKGYLSDPLTSLRLAGLLIAGMETLSTMTPQPMLHALGGWLGSLGVVAVAKQSMADLQSAGMAQVTENQAVALLFLGLAGYDIGRLLADYGYQGMDKHFTRARLQDVFCQWVEEKNLTGCVTDFNAQPMWSPSFWLTTRDHVHMGWTANGTFHETDCEVIPLAQGQRAMLCEEPLPRQYLPLQ